MLVSPGRPFDAYLSLATKTPPQKADAPAAAVTVTQVVDAGDTEDQSASIALYLGSDAGFYIDAPSVDTGDEIGDSALALTQKGKAWKAGKATVLALRGTDDGGYELLLRTGAGAKASYSIQKFDGEGVAVGKASKMSLAETLAAEKDFDQDINADGEKGDIVAEVVDDDDGNQQVGFYKLASGSYAIDQANLLQGFDTTGDLVLLTSKGKSWSAGKGDALAVRVAESGYEVLIKTGDGAKAKYSIQAFNSDGVAVGKAIAMKPADLFDAEIDFEQDFNDDSINGDYVTDTIADADSVLSLYMLKSGFYGVGESGAQEGVAGSAADVVRLTDKGKAWSPGKSSAVALAPVGDGNDPTGAKVILKTGSGAKAKISEATFTMDGVVSGKPVSLKGDALKATEIAYDRDFDDDGKVGTSAFSIKINYTGPEPNKYKPYFEAAAVRWSEIILNDLPDVTNLYVPWTQYAGYTELGNKTYSSIDDLLIEAVLYDGGANGNLGSAGPIASRADGMPIVGRMRFNTHYMQDMITSKTFGDVILHEMGHVLGLGTRWNEFKDQAGNYVGPKAVAQYSMLKGSSQSHVPIEDNGGAGSAGSHWEAKFFDTELMTWQAEGAPPMPLSKVTVGSLEDLGYTVSYSSADSFTLPVPSDNNDPELNTHKTASGSIFHCSLWEQMENGTIGIETHESHISILV